MSGTSSVVPGGGWIWFSQILEDVMLREEQLVGLDYLGALTTLLQRIRSTHPTAGLYDTAEMQFWWTRCGMPLACHRSRPASVD